MNTCLARYRSMIKGWESDYELFQDKLTITAVNRDENQLSQVELRHCSASYDRGTHVVYEWNRRLSIIIALCVLSITAILIGARFLFARRIDKLIFADEENTIVVFLFGAAVIGLSIFLPRLKRRRIQQFVVLKSAQDGAQLFVFTSALDDTHLFNVFVSQVVDAINQEARKAPLPNGDYDEDRDAVKDLRIAPGRPGPPNIRRGNAS